LLDTTVTEIPRPLVIGFDRDPAAARATASFLRASGFDVVIERSLAAVLDTHPPIDRLVAVITEDILDARLRGIDETLKLRRLCGWDVPALLLSDRSDLPPAAADITGLECLPKPADPIRLQAWLERCRTGYATRDR
jgi:DNA-binding response OmpR family regulator